MLLIDKPCSPTTFSTHPTTKLPRLITNNLRHTTFIMDAQIAEWQTRAEALKPLNLKAIEPALLELDAHLTLRTYIVGYTLTDADTVVWKTIRENRVAHAYVKQDLMKSLCRWFRFVEETGGEKIVLAVRGAKETKDGKEKNDDANFDIGLQDVGDGTGIVTRFPPEPS